MELYESQTVVIFCWLNCTFQLKEKMWNNEMKACPLIFHKCSQHPLHNVLENSARIFSRSLVDEENPLFTPALHQSDLRKLFFALAYSLCFSEALNSFSSNLMLEWWNWLIRRHHQAPNSSRNKSKSFFSLHHIAFLSRSVYTHVFY